ncbi:MAG: methionyl-tRNA formyltransferase [Pseudomonadota bacterium]
MPLRLAFMGTPDFSVPVLDALVSAGHEVAAVYTQPPRKAGRGMAVRPSPVQARAEALGLGVRYPASLKGEDEKAAFAALDLDVAVVIAYGLILPKAVLAAPRHGCLNLHASLLPRWRGAAPIQRAIMAGDAETGVCVMRMEAGLDTGPVCLQEAVPIGPDDTAGALHDTLSALSAKLIVPALTALEEGTLACESQPEEGVVYAQKIDKAEARIDWSQPGETVDRTIRGLSPFPGAWTEIEGTRLKLLGSRIGKGGGPPGTVLSDDLAIACGTGAVRPTRVQPAGRGPMSVEEFLRGRPVPIGHLLG